MTRFLHHSAVFAALALSLVAQPGNEILFVGTSTSGTTDTSAFVASGSGQVIWQGPSSFTNNVSGAVWTDTGRNLYVGQSLDNRVARASWDGMVPTWSTFWTGPGPCYGLGVDASRKRLWVLSGSSAPSRELFCLDADTNSPGYGQVLAQTTVLAGATRERWALSRSGNFAVVPHIFLQAGLLEVVVTDPSSPSFLQTVVSTPVPGAVGASLSFAAEVQMSVDDQYVFVLYGGFGASGLAVWDLAAGAWLDFSGAPGQQNFSLGISLPSAMALSIDRSFALVCGSNAVERIDFDYAMPSNSAGTFFSGLGVPNCHGVTLSADNQRAAVSSTAQVVGPPGRLVVFDAVAGTLLQDVQLGTMWNIYTTAWQDASPTATFDLYGGGCAGALGVPSLAAAPGQRPALGTTFQVIANRLPLNVALLQVGLDATTFGGLPLPFDLSVIGMPGCLLWLAPISSLLLTGAGGQATWSWLLPNDPMLFGARVYLQAFPIQPGANPFGFIASDAAVAKLGL
jgi:hypothetical protein